MVISCKKKEPEAAERQTEGKVQETRAEILRRD